jgi:hypothetical protein
MSCRKFYPFFILGEGWPKIEVASRNSVHSGGDSRIPEQQEEQVIGDGLNNAMQLLPDQAKEECHCKQGARDGCDG